MKSYENNNGGGNSGASGWENMGNPYSYSAPNSEATSTSAEKAEAMNRARQERKIIAVFGTRQGDFLDYSYINAHDVRIDDSMRDEVMRDLASGAITDADKKAFLHHIKLPTDREGGITATFQKLSSKHEKRILAEMTPVGFNNWRNASGVDLLDFLRTYPTPMDFDAAASEFLDRIGRLNGQQKRQEYEQAMASFRQKVFDKREEYWQRIKALENEARRTYGYQGSEVERSSEWQPGEAGYWQTSRGQVEKGMVTRENIDGGLWADNLCQDSCLVREDQFVYGVFDGAGGHVGGREASNHTAAVVDWCCNQYILKSGSDLAWALNYANEMVANNERAGLSTAALTKVVEIDGRLKLAYALVGDSRIYVVDKNGEAQQIGHDEGYGNVITNWIGTIDEEHPRDCTWQFGEIELHEGDRVVLCSDGITGDKPEELMSDHELGEIVSRSTDAKDAAKNLIANARKNDDRTAIVFGGF